MFACKGEGGARVVTRQLAVKPLQSPSLCLQQFSISTLYQQHNSQDLDRPDPPVLLCTSPRNTLHLLLFFLDSIQLSSEIKICTLKHLEFCP
jgi:hypothetical protein